MWCQGRRFLFSTRRHARCFWVVQYVPQWCFVDHYDWVDRKVVPNFSCRHEYVVCKLLIMRIALLRWWEYFA
jgi:hypothetical protein